MLWNLPQTATYNNNVWPYISNISPCEKLLWSCCHAVSRVLASKLFSARKSVFLQWDQNFVNDPFLALRETVHLAPWDRLFDFSFPSYGCFRKKIFPTPLQGHRLPVTALAPSARGLGNSWDYFGSTSWLLGNLLGATWGLQCTILILLSTLGHHLDYFGATWCSLWE